MIGRIHLAIHALLIGVIVALAIHIKGLWFIDGLEDRLEQCRETVLALNAEGDKAEAVSGAIAKGEGKRHVENLAVSSAAARRHIARHRLPEAGGAPGGSDPLSGGAGPAATVPELDQGGEPEPLLPDSPALPGAEPGWVAVREDDVLICTDNYETNWTGYSAWQALKAEGLARPEGDPFPQPELSQ